MSLHVLPVWLGKWKVSITFSRSNHAVASGGGSGSGVWATQRPSRLHMLLLARILGAWPSDTCKDVSQCNNTYLGDSDLQQWVEWKFANNKTYTCKICVLLYKYNYSVVFPTYVLVKWLPHIYSICSPAQTTNSWPLGHFLRFRSIPEILVHTAVLS